jgi:hypothetical protein
MLTILNLILYALPKVLPSYLYRRAKEEALHSHIKISILGRFQSLGGGNEIGLLQKKTKEKKKLKGTPFN